MLVASVNRYGDPAILRAVDSDYHAISRTCMIYVRGSNGLARLTPPFSQ